MNLIITAGGTTERIDDVRSITNTSTGNMGLAVGNAFLANYAEEIDTLYYVCGQRAKALEGDKVELIRINGAQDLKDTLEQLLQEQHIDAVIHSMAVSDYTVKELATLDSIKRGETLPAGNKISSQIDDLVMIMKRTPKVISAIKEISPGTLLVGFKLLSHVPLAELIDVGHALLLKNQCSFVLANDLQDITPETHKGHLIHPDKTFETMETKAEIGQRIALRVMESLRTKSASEEVPAL